MGIYYHGTTEQGLEQILNGDGTKTSVWECSENDSYMYFWDAKKSREEYGLEDEDIGVLTIANAIKNQQSEPALRYAIESAAVQAAALNQTTLYILIAEFEEDIAEEDTSCPNMSHTPAVRVYQENLNLRKHIKHIFKMNCSAYLHPVILAGFLENDMIEAYKWENVHPTCLKLAKALAKNDDAMCELYDWYTYEDLHDYPVASVWPSLLHAA